MTHTPRKPDATDLLRAPARASLYACSEDAARAMFQAGPAAGCNVYRIDLGLATDAAKLHHVLARALHFPEWYGRNWDALADCLTDMSWSEADGYVLALQRADLLQVADPASFGILVDILEDAVMAWREQGIAFWVLFIGEFPQFSTLEVRA